MIVCVRILYFVLELERKKKETKHETFFSLSKINHPSDVSAVTIFSLRRGIKKKMKQNKTLTFHQHQFTRIKTPASVFYRGLDTAGPADGPLSRRKF